MGKRFPIYGATATLVYRAPYIDHFKTDIKVSPAVLPVSRSWSASLPTGGSATIKGNPPFISPDQEGTTLTF